MLAERAWHERVNRRLADGRHAREQADAAHDFLDAVSDEPAADWLAGVAAPTEIVEHALRKFLNELGRITGVGPMP